MWNARVESHPSMCQNFDVTYAMLCLESGLFFYARQLYRRYC